MVRLWIQEGVAGLGRETRALDVELGASVRDSVRQAGVCPERIGLVTVGGRLPPMDRCLEGDRPVCLFPYLLAG